MVSFGDFKGGLLWIEGTSGQGPATQTKAPMSLTRRCTGPSNPAALKRQAEILEAAQECPDPRESCYIPPPDEPVTGMKEFPKDILEWEYAAALESASKRAKEEAERRRDPAPLSGGPSGEAASSSGLPHASFDEVVSAMPYRAESHRTFSAIKEAMAAEAGSSGFMKARPADYVGINYQDDLDLMEMLTR